MRERWDVQEGGVGKWRAVREKAERESGRAGEREERERDNERGVRGRCTLNSFLAASSRANHLLRSAISASSSALRSRIRGRYFSPLSAFARVTSISSFCNLGGDERIRRRKRRRERIIGMTREREWQRDGRVKRKER